MIFNIVIRLYIFIANIILKLTKVADFIYRNSKIIGILVLVILIILFLRNTINFCDNPFLDFLCK